MTDEILKDAELDEVVGGSGIETIAMMSRLQIAGLATFKTPLVAGNEEAAATEFTAYLKGLKYDDGSPILANPKVYADGRANNYFADMNIIPGNPRSNENALFDMIRYRACH